MPHPNLTHFEDCTDIIASLRLADEQRSRIREAPANAFTPIGIGHIAVLELDLPLGIRKRQGGRLQERVARGLVAAGKLLAHAPAMEGTVPLFSAVVLDENGQPVGTLTQDFSNGGSTPLRKELFGIPIMGPLKQPTPLHAVVHDALGPVNIDRKAFGSMSAATTGWEPTRYMVDYETLLRPDHDRVQMDAIMGRIDELTISSS